jgi:biopolymer transport protein ExbD
MRVAKAAAVKADINVTPLVDVCLVLLIIFMVITPMLQKGPPVKLPQTQDPPKKPEDQEQILVAIGQDRLIWLESDKKTEKITPEQFAARIMETFQRNPGSTAVVKGDARLTYGDVKRIMLEIKEAGFPQVGLIVEKRGG